MLELCLVRHAKSSWKDLSLDDYDRPLNKRGKLSADFISQKLQDERLVPELIISSSAKRAKQTAKIFSKTLKVPIDFNTMIYDASKHELYEIIRMVSNEYKKLFLIGHNPTLNELAYELVKLHENIPTCGIVHIQFKCKNWNEINSNCAKKVQFLFPKKYNDFFNYF